MSFRWSALAAGLAASALLAGCLNEFEEPESPHYVQIVGIDVQPSRVFSQDVLLNVTTTLDNRGGGEARDVRLEAKAYSEERGFLVTENSTMLGTLPGERTQEVPIFLRVPREGGVRIEVVLLEEELGQQRASVTARNLASLEPEVLDTGLRISDVDFLVRNVTNDSGSVRAEVRADLYVTNEGDAASEDLQVQVKAREVQTGLIADIGWVSTGSVAPGSTTVRSATVNVANGYNYVFEILTWRGESIVARSEGTVQLAPTFVKPTDTEIVTTSPDLGDFVTRGPVGMSPDMAGSGAYPTADSPDVPGPGLAMVLAGVAAAAAIVARTTRRRT